jgi:PAS domain S-box-containing protein
MFERLYGAKEADIVGKTDYDFVDKELADFFRENDQKAMTAGKPSSYEECVTFTDDGHRALLDSTKTPMLDEDGKIVGVLGVGRDVTERKQTEDKIKEALSFNQQIIDSAKQGIIVYDLSLRYRVWNPFMEQITGVKAADVLGKTPLEVFPFLEGSGVLERLQTILKGKTADSVEFPFHIETTGKSGWTSDSSAALSNATGEVIGVIGIVQNLTEQRETQAQLQQAQKMESIGRLAGGVAHDFNNMLSVILGHAELGLMHLDPTHRVCNDLKEISKTAERSADLTRQLLAFARKQTVSPKVVDLNGIISGMLKMLQGLIGENIHLTCQSAANLWSVKVDPSQIDQILANLCVNARDAIKDNGRITIETQNCTIDTNFCKNHLEAVPGEYVRLSVSDDGVGMDKETILHVFEPFYTTKALGKGTGLGLSTVYGAVKQNNGFINIYSEPGHGTTFSIYLPRDAGSRSGQTMEEEGSVAQVARGQETILLVEDDPAILNVTSQMLEGQGYTVLKASAPGEALQLVSEHSGMIHLLMTDVVMPELNGSDLAKKILASYPQIKRLFMSGYTADVIAHHGVLDEGVHFIQKPFSLSNMAAKVREVLDSN